MNVNQLEKFKKMGLDIMDSIKEMAEKDLPGDSDFFMTFEKNRETLTKNFDEKMKKLLEK